MLRRGAIKCRLCLRCRSRNAHQIRFVMRSNVRTAVDMQTPFLFPRQPRQGFTPTLGIAAHEFVQFVPMLENGAKTGRDNGARVHGAFQNALMHGGLMGHPRAVGGMPLRGVDITNHEREVSKGDRAARFAVRDKAPSRKFR